MPAFLCLLFQVKPQYGLGLEVLEEEIDVLEQIKNLGFGRCRPCLLWLLLQESGVFIAAFNLVSDFIFNL